LLQRPEHCASNATVARRPHVSNALTALILRQGRGRRIARQAAERMKAVHFGRFHTGSSSLFAVAVQTRISLQKVVSSAVMEGVFARPNNPL
jgi:hypothetical protein